MPEAAVHFASGKVREIYELDSDRLLLVASDRISTFDVVLPSEIPDKGRVLTGLSAFWFARTHDLCANHLLRVREDGRSTECRRLEMLPIECVVRGYLAGSGWKDYRRNGQTSGRVLPAGLRESDRLPAPIFTPSTSQGLYFSQRVLLALVDSGLQRDDAYVRVQQSAMRAWEEERPFRDVVGEDAELAGQLDLDAVFDPAAYTRHVDTVFDRLNALVAEREGIHA